LPRYTVFVTRLRISEVLGRRCSHHSAGRLRSGLRALDVVGESDDHVGVNLETARQLRRRLLGPRPQPPEGLGDGLVGDPEGAGDPQRRQAEPGEA